MTGSLPDAIHRGPLIEVAPDSARIGFPSAGRMLIRADSITRVPDDGCAEVDLAMLEDPAIALQWLLRGVPSLRASAVARDGVGVVLAGEAMTGKSAIAASLASMGWQVLADSVAPIRGNSGGGDTDGIEIMPTTDVLHLWPVSMPSLGLDPRDGVALRPGIGKLAVTLERVSDASVALSTIVILRRIRSSTSGLQMLSGVDAIGAVDHLMWHAAGAKALLGPGPLFMWATGIARNVSIVAIDLDDGFDPNGVARIIDDMVGETPGGRS